MSNSKGKHDVNIELFWQTGAFSELSGALGKKIHFATFLSETSDDWIVIVPGRTESLIKYKEVCFELLTYGYNLCLIDHRGQGFSERLTTNPHKGYVEDFDYYCQDLNQLIGKAIPKSENGKRFILAHSMGGAIAAKTLQNFPDLAIDAVVLSSPMLGINSGPLPQPLAKLVVSIGHWFNQLVSNQAWYFVGQSDFSIEPFKKNSLTNSEMRYKTMMQQYLDFPEIQLGGVTFHWLHESLKAIEHLMTERISYDIPTLILQAEKDTIVDNNNQEIYCQKLNCEQRVARSPARPLVFKNAKHELLFEEDSIRSSALSQIINWFENYRQN